MCPPSFIRICPPLFKRVIVCILFFRFPRSRPNIMKRWLANVGMTNCKLSKLAVLCSDHFKESCFDKTGQTTRLRDDAVPTIFEFSKRLTRVCVSLSIHN
uniref:THAP-type domain-containing protein n=1 Tax=Eptatretus burgeri TaxID=7764 RepID=A0A8C4N220_EPTBU